MALKPDIQDLARADELFKGEVPNLFEECFEQNLKGQAESMKVLSKAKAPPPK